MTGVGTALALIPLFMSGNAPGKEFLHPLAIVILGGAHYLNGHFIALYARIT